MRAVNPGGVKLCRASSFDRTVCGIVLLRDDGAALLQHRDNKPGLPAAGQWVFPGGHCEPGEDLLQCAIREFEEETAYCCKNPHWLVTLPDCYGEWPSYELVIFWDLYDGKQLYECREGSALEFVPRHCASEIPLVNFQKHVWDLALLYKSLLEKERKCV